ncbi:MAG: sigma 54-interacting transcriptional regulator [Syntrophomonadaceae bacterium]
MLDEQDLTMTCVRDYLFDDPYQAVIATDSRGRVIFVNNTYLIALGFSREEVMGRYIEDITPYTHAMKVLRSGQADDFYIFTCNGEDSIGRAHPVIKSGRIIGVVCRSMFLNMNGPYRFTEMILNFQRRADEARKLQRQQENLLYSFDSIIGENRDFQKVKHLAQKMAMTYSTILITGETGTGKDLFAKAIHSASRRKDGPFIRVNCAAIPENLLEAELFGFEDGVFTGARKGGQKGKFLLADGGTIFLDEIAEMTPFMQSKLLTVLQEREVDPLGNQRHPISIDIRVIAATNKDLKAMQQEGSFRKDLFYRLNVMELNIPPLRERRDDIQSLAKLFLKKYIKRENVEVHAIHPDVFHSFYSYDWPGNVRELENIIEQAALIASLEESSSITPEHISELLNPQAESNSQLDFIEDVDLKEYMDLCEKNKLLEVLKASNGSKKLAADKLGLHISALYKKINKYSLEEILK